MTKGDGASLAAIALSLINRSFANRLPPSELTDSMQLSDVEYAEVMSFQRQLAFQSE